MRPSLLHRPTASRVLAAARTLGTLSVASKAPDRLYQDPEGWLLTFLRPSAASSRFCSSSREVSFLLGGEESMGLSGERSEGDLRMTSKLWPEALLSSCFTSMSARQEQTGASGGLLKEGAGRAHTQVKV